MRTQPELVLYDPTDHSRGHGYPDLVRDGAALFITETFKSQPYSEAKTPTKWNDVVAKETGDHYLVPKNLDMALENRKLKAIRKGSK